MTRSRGANQVKLVLRSTDGEDCFAERVDRSTVSKSRYLASVARAGGEATLPESLEVAELRKWITVVEMRSNAAKSGVSALCIVTKAAHILGDKYEEKWVEAFGNALVAELKWQEWGSLPDVNSDLEDVDVVRSYRCFPELLLSERFTSFSTFIGDSKAAKVANSLSMLPDNLQQQVFANVGGREAGDCEYGLEYPFSDCLLAVMPNSIRKNVIASMLGQDKTLTLKAQNHASKSVSNALTTLQSIDFDCGPVETLHIDGEEVSIAELCATLQHRSIAQLKLGRMCCDLFLHRDFIHAQPPLSALQSLHLMKELEICTAGCCETIRGVLSAMPGLKHLELAISLARAVVGTANPPYGKRKRDAPDQPPASAPSVHTFLEVASGLTSLTIEAKGPDQCGRCHGCSSVFFLPSLKEAVLRSKCIAFTFNFLGKLKAPLKKVEIAADGIKGDTSKVTIAKANYLKIFGLSKTYVKHVESLHIVGLTLHANARTSLLPSLAPMKKLAYLQLHAGSIPSAVCEYFDSLGSEECDDAETHVDHANAHSFLPPALQDLDVELDGSWAGCRVKAFVRAACALPSLKNLTLISASRGWPTRHVVDHGAGQGQSFDFGVSEAGAGSGSDDDSLHSDHHDGEDDECVVVAEIDGLTQSLHEIASAAGVTLSLCGPIESDSDDEWDADFPF